MVIVDPKPFIIRRVVLAVAIVIALVGLVVALAVQ